MNDERPIEKLLRRHAQKRRDEAGEPPVLHPATRRLLQGEVARQFPKSGKEDKPSHLGLFALLAHRWIYALGVFVVLAVTAAVLLPGFLKSGSNDTLALKSDSAQPRETEAIVAPLPAAPVAVATEPSPTLTIAQDRVNAPPPKAQPPVTESRQRDESLVARQPMVMYQTASRSDADALRKAEEAKRVEPTPSSRVATRSIQTATPQSQPRPTGAVVSGDSYSAKQLETASSRTVAESISPRPSTTPVPLSLAPSGPAADQAFGGRGGSVEKDTGQVYSQSFANVAPQLDDKAVKAKAAAPATPVLANFQIQQSGNELRVIDSDGSTYRGALNAAQASYGVAAPTREATASYESAGLRRNQASASTANVAPTPTQDFFYRVEGTNRTLNQNVVFTWNFIETNALAVSTLNYDATGQKLDASKLPSQFPAQLNKSIINGRAQLGPNQQIEINAVPVKQ